MPTTRAKPKVEDVPIGRLKPNPDNPRVISRDAFLRLCYSLRADPEMLWARPLIARLDGTVVAGNMRLRAAEELGWETVPTIIVDIDDDTADLWMLRDNQNYGDWHDDQLAEQLYRMQERGLDMALTGFSAKAVDDFIAKVAGGMAEVHGTALAALDVSIGDPQHRVERGQVWRVGVHHLVVVDVFTGWPEFSRWLQPGSLLVPYPTPMMPLTEKANESHFVLVQPDEWMAGHLLDKFASVRGDDAVALCE